MSQVKSRFLLCLDIRTPNTYAKSGYVRVETRGREVRVGSRMARREERERGLRRYSYKTFQSTFPSLHQFVLVSILLEGIHVTGISQRPSLRPIHATTGIRESDFSAKPVGRD